jgi:hypothetical protein
MKVYFITRFSICDPDFKGFRLSSHYDREEYEKRLFAPARLEHKFDTFETITVPSVLGQTCPDWEWLIYTSDRLPPQYMNRLREAVAASSNIRILTVSNFKEFFDADRNYAYQSPFATVRLDDDDGLNKEYVAKVQKYSNHVGGIISFTDGLKVQCIGRKIVYGDKMSEKNNAQGMVGIEVKVYSCGRHTDMDSRYKVIYDATPDMYLIDCSPFTDTKRAFTGFGRVWVKLSRLAFLAFNRPSEFPAEFAAPFKKLLRRP